MNATVDTASARQEKQIRFLLISGFLNSCISVHLVSEPANRFYNGRVLRIVLYLFAKTLYVNRKRVIVDEISDELIGDIFPTLYSSDERKWREFLFNHFYRFTRKQQQMGKIHPQNLNVLFARMDNKMQQKESNFPAETIRDKYIAIGTVGLINSITKKWMDSGAKETPEEMIDFIMSLFFSVKK